MGLAASDEELLIQQDAASFELFYNRYFERLLGFFARRTTDAELAADLTAETFAAALAARRRYRRQRGRADSWLFAIAYHKLADAQRRGYDEIAAELETSEAVVRKRVSRGLAAIRRRLGGVW